MPFKIKTSIKKKILVSISSVIIVTLIAGGIISYNYFSLKLREQAVHDYEINLQLNGKQLDYAAEDIEKLAQEFSRDKVIQKTLKENSEKQDMVQVGSLVEEMRYLNNLRGYVDSSVIITEKKNLYWSSFPYDKYFDNKLKEDWYVNFKGKNTYSGFSEAHDIFKGGKNSVKVVSYITTIKSDSEYDNVIGELILNIKFDYFRDFLETESKEFDGYALLDEYNNILFSRSSENPPIYLSKLINSLPTVGGKKEYIKNSYDHVVINEPLNNGWKLIAFNSNKKIFQKISYIIYFFIALSAVSIIVIILILAKIINGFINPVLYLTKSMESVSKGELDTRVEIISNDELGTMGNSFNKMTEELQIHIDKSIEYEKNKRKMEFELLLSQINPHFIYNTLNTVTYMARKQKNYDIVDLINAFIIILQDAIKLGNPGKELFSTIGQEIEVVNSYITIQKYRYRDKFNVQWKVEEELNNALIPKTILQPIIENSIYHGIAPMEKEGVINISIGNNDQSISLIVEDNGIGIEEETLENIFKGRKKEKKGQSLRSIGITNITSRLKYLYGEECSVKIESEIGKGTRVILKFPLCKEGGLK